MANCCNQTPSLIQGNREEIHLYYSVMKVDMKDVNQGGTKQRRKAIIETPSSANYDYAISRRGARSDTKELNINIKTINSAFLRMVKSQHEFSPEQNIVVQQYFSMQPNFKSLRFLGLSPQHETNAELKIARKGIRYLLFQFYNSSQFLKRVMSSTRMHYRNKMVMVKFMRKIAEKVLGDHKQPEGWKDKAKIN